MRRRARSLLDRRGRASRQAVQLSGEFLTEKTAPVPEMAPFFSQVVQILPHPGDGFQEVTTASERQLADHQRGA